MQVIADTFGVAVGYSDHTEGTSIPIAAVAMGATVIESISLDRNMYGPDHKASLDPDQFVAMVRGIRTIEQALGDGIKRSTPSELTNKVSSRKSLVASRLIQKGDVFSQSNLTCKRPGSGISPMYWDLFIGRTSSRQYKPDDLIEW